MKTAFFSRVFFSNNNSALLQKKKAKPTRKKEKKENQLETKAENRHFASLSDPLSVSFCFSVPSLSAT